MRSIKPILRYVVRQHAPWAARVEVAMEPDVTSPLQVPRKAVLLICISMTAVM